MQKEIKKGEMSGAAAPLQDGAGIRFLVLHDLNACVCACSVSYDGVRHLGAITRWRRGTTSAFLGRMRCSMLIRRIWTHSPGPMGNEDSPLLANQLSSMGI